MNISTIHQAVTAVLRRNPIKIDDRRQSIAALRKGLEKGLPLPLPRRRAWYSTTQTDVTNAKACARVQVLGVEAGELILGKASKSWEFVPNAKRYPQYAGARWAWSKNAADGKKIRDFLGECEKHPEADPLNEREIQWQLANALGAKTTSLRNLSAVKWNKRFTEVGVSVTKEGKAGTGNIDLVVRRGKGGDRGFLVFEVKGPDDTNVEAALKQALRYAEALSIEANGGNKRNREDYHAVFESKGKETLQIDAVIVMANLPEVRRRAADLVSQYLADRGDSAIERIGVLLYDFDAKAGKVREWKWLEGRDPRNATP